MKVCPGIAARNARATNGANGEKLSAKRGRTAAAELADADVFVHVPAAAARGVEGAAEKHRGGAERDSSGVATSESRVLSRIKWRRGADECQMVQ